MPNTRVQLNHPLPAPVVHAGFSIPQSKSHVLAGVQDAYWSDDEAEDAECPLCLEEMDISDLNFKPCVCGYQICRFCWHHIKENLNGRCPACRRVYTDEAVEFKPINKEDHKRLTQQKKQRERERKELDNLGRRHLANVRVVQRNVVYVVGMGPRFAKEELIPTLRSHEYFGQYGKISKVILVKRTPSGGGAPVLGTYLTYHRREDAARCIAAVDGTPTPGGGGREVMRASYGTTKYCMAFLRGVTCNDHNCMNLHEWGDEKDCFTKEDLTTLKHTIKATESRTRNIVTGKKGDEADGLPKAAAWARSPNVQSSLPATNQPGPSTSRQPRRVAGVRQGRTNAPTAEYRSGIAKDRKHTYAPKPSSQASSRPPTPALAQRPATPPEVKALRYTESKAPQPSQSPTPSTVESDVGSGVGPTSPSVRPRSTDSLPSSVPSVPPGIPAVPPGLSAPPGIPSPSRPPRVESASPHTPLLASQSSYQMSTAARALIDDVKARREAALPSSTTSPFPDLDRMLQTLARSSKEFGGFSFNLDPNLVGNELDADQSLPDFEAEANLPFHGTYMDAFPALRSTGPPPGLASLTPPPGLPYPHNPNSSIYDPYAFRASPIVSVERQPTGGSSYTGSFNPFADANDDKPDSIDRRPRMSPLDDDNRKVSRFGFARGRQGSTAASSPLHTSSPVSANDSQPMFQTTDFAQNSSLLRWLPPGHLLGRSGSVTGSRLVPQAQAIPGTVQSKFQPFEPNISEAQLRNFIHSSREMANSHSSPSSNDMNQIKMGHAQLPFNDPAIMSAKFAPPVPSVGYMSPPLDNMTPHLGYGPPPGLSIPPSYATNSQSFGGAMESNGITHVVKPPTPVLSASDFPALPTPATSVENSRQSEVNGTDDTASSSNAPSQPAIDKKAAKKAAAAEKAAEKQRLAQEKAAAKAAEKARLAQEKAAEKERAAALKAQQEREKAEKERIAQEKEMERAAKAEKEKIVQAEKERLAQAEKEKKQNKKAEKKAIQRTESTSNTGQPTNRAPPKPSPPAPPELQVPLLSKKPKKNKPVTRLVKVQYKEEDNNSEDTPVNASESSHVTPQATPADTSATTSRTQSLDGGRNKHSASLKELLAEINILNPAMDTPYHPFFDSSKINPVAKMPLEYGPLVHALSALSVGGGSFASNIPSGSIDNAVSSFQQLLETLTQTISDLLRLLPRTTWDDSSSFDGVLRDMLKGDDFLDEGADDGHGKEDEVAALTLALERRARWMEVQLSKLEELHRDINTAAVRAVLSFNDSGWDRHGSLPRLGNTLKRFDSIGMVVDGEKMRAMTVDELEKKLAVAKEAADFAEAEVRETMGKMQTIRPVDSDFPL